jgi:hypothetical protein
MALPDAVVGAVYRERALAWEDTEGNAISLVGATLSARIRDIDAETERLSDGVFTLTNPSAGAFTWKYGEDDLAVAGDFVVELIATYAGGETDISLPIQWRIHPAI